MARDLRPCPASFCGLPDLRGGEGAGRESRIAETNLDFDDAVSPHPRAHGERQLEEGELEMGDLQSLRRDGDLAIGGKACRTETMAKGLLDFGGGNDQDRSLNLEHDDLFQMNVLSPEYGCGLVHGAEEVWDQVFIEFTDR